jgi:molybdopterin-biosynthesis enzyme MoeA-like protein
MFDGLAPALAGGDRVLSRTVTCDLGEGVIAAGLGAIAAEYPDLSVGSYPYFRAGKFGTSLVLRGTDAARLSTATEAVRVLVVSLGGAAGAEPEKPEPEKAE